MGVGTSVPKWRASKLTKVSTMNNIVCTSMKIEENLPIIVMDHNPINIKEYDANINLLLSGHTHKGQIFPANLITDKMYVVDYGLYNENVNYPVTIVSSGAGTWGMPMRIGSHSEVVLIKLNK